MEAGPVDTEASEAGAQAQGGPDPGHWRLVTILWVTHDVHIHIEGSNGGQEA